MLAWGRQRAFFNVVAAQFSSSLAYSALLIAAIGLLLEQHAVGWMTPALRILFYLPYLLLAAFAGAVADYFPKGRVMFGTNLVKLGGCALLLAQVHPLFAYAVVGLGAATYSPAKYGILPVLFIGFRVFVTLAMLLIVARHGVIRYRLSAVSACGSVR